MTISFLDGSFGFGQKLFKKMNKKIYLLLFVISLCAHLSAQTYKMKSTLNSNNFLDPLNWETAAPYAGAPTPVNLGGYYAINGTEIILTSSTQYNNLMLDLSTLSTSYTSLDFNINISTALPSPLYSSPGLVIKHNITSTWSSIVSFQGTTNIQGFFLNDKVVVYNFGTLNTNMIYLYDESGTQNSGTMSVMGQLIDLRSFSSSTNPGYPSFLNDYGATMIFGDCATADPAIVDIAGDMGNGGIIKGYATFDNPFPFWYTSNNISNLGTLIPGCSPGAFTFNCAVPLDDLELEIEGTGSGQYDHIGGSGTKSLTGADLTVTTASSYTPASGDVIPLVSAPYSGTFASVSLPTTTGITWTLQYNTGSVDAVASNNTGLRLIEPEDENVESRSKKDFVVYPNPCEDMLKVEGDVIDHVTIYSALGQRVYDEVYQATEIDLSHLPPGVYLLRTSFRGMPMNERSIMKK